MNKNVFIVILILGLCTIGFLWYNDTGDYKEQVKELKKKRDSLEVDSYLLRYQNDSLLELEPEIYWRTYKSKEKLKKQQNETDAIPGIVATYTDRKLDSILTNHRFISREKSRDSIND